MAEPTLKDVLKAIAAIDAKVTALEKGQAALEKGQAALEKGQSQIRSEMATKVEMNARFDAVDARLADIDADLNRHMTVHRELEKDVQALKRRPPRTAARA